eukprot:9360828-Alexandrium_andersonii.AAC.1
MSIWAAAAMERWSSPCSMTHWTLCATSRTCVFGPDAVADNTESNSCNTLGSGKMARVFATVCEELVWPRT